MPRILLDRHIDEAAMQRRDDSPSHYSRGGKRPARRATVASVVHGAVGSAPVAVTRPAPVRTTTAQPARREVASHLTDRDEREIRFDDLPPENPNLLTSHPRHAAPVDEHVTHHQLPHGFELRVVPMPETDAELCDSVELAIARFAIAVSDLALLPGGVRALVMLLAAHVDRPVSTYDRRPLGAPVGRELSGVSA